MSRILDELLQLGIPAGTPCLQLGPKIVYIVTGDVTDIRTGHKEKLKPPEHVLLLELLFRALTSPRDYVSALVLARIVCQHLFPILGKPEHVVQTYMWRLRDKLEEDGEPQYILGCQNKGYKLNLDNAYLYSITFQMLQKLLPSLRTKLS